MRSQGKEGAPLALRHEWLDDCEEAGVCLDEAVYLVHKARPSMEVRISLIAQVGQRYAERDAALQRSMAAAQKRRAAERLGGGGGPALKRRRRQHSGEDAYADSMAESSPCKPSALGAIANDIANAAALSVAERSKKPQASKWEEQEEAAAGAVKLDAGRRIAPPQERSHSVPNPTTAPKSGNPFSKGAGLETQDVSSAVSPVKREPLTNLSQETSKIRPQEDSIVSKPEPEEQKARAGEVTAQQPPNGKASGVFAGMTIRVPASAVKGEKMKGAIRQHGGKVAESAEEEATHTVHGMTERPQENKRDGCYVTPLWLEANIVKRRRVEPSRHVGYEPARATLPIKSDVPLCVHLTGFDALARSHVEKVVVALGGSVSDAFTKRDTHLIVPERIDGNNPKCVKAEQFGTPIVRADEFLRNAYDCGFYDPAPVMRSQASRTGFSQMPATAQAATKASSLFAGPSTSTTRVMAHSVHSRATAPNFAPEDSLGQETSAVLAEQIKAQLGKSSARPKKQDRRRPRPSKRPISGMPRAAAASGSGDRSRSVSVLDMDDEALSAPSEAQDDDAEEEHPELLQTQVVVSYDNPKARREQRKLMAMLNGSAATDSLASNRTESFGRTASTASTDLNVGTSRAAAAGPSKVASPRRARSANNANPIKARHQPGVKR